MGTEGAVAVAASMAAAETAPGTQATGMVSGYSVVMCPPEVIPVAASAAELVETAGVGRIALTSLIRKHYVQRTDRHLCSRS